MNNVAKWLIRTFTTDAGGKPVDDWIKSLDPSARAEVAWTIDMLRQHGVQLAMPYVRYLDDGVWELRARDAGGIYRVLYFHWKGRTLACFTDFRRRRKPHQERALTWRRRAELLG